MKALTRQPPEPRVSDGLSSDELAEFARRYARSLTADKPFDPHAEIAAVRAESEQSHAA